MRTSMIAFCVFTLGSPAAHAQNDALLKAVTLYASFDEKCQADYARGPAELATRSVHDTEKGQFVHTPGIDHNVFRINKKDALRGGALDPKEALPKNGRIYFPVKNHLSYKPGGWSGAVSVWCNTDPNATIQAKFCDPIQITHKGAGDGGIWFDFNDAKPRDLRLGTFPAVVPGVKPAKESDADAPMVRVPKVDWKAGQWHHVVLSWKNFDTGKPDAVASLYIDGKHIGDVKNRAIAMSWDVDKAGIYIAVGYLGLLDELTVFERALTPAEVGVLHQEPDFAKGLKKKS